MLLDYDNLNIGKTISLKALKRGTIESEAIGRAYELKYRPDLIGNQADINDGQNDDTVVFEVVEKFSSSINTLLQNAKDPLNTAIATMDVEHYEIHEENHYFCSCVQAMEGNATIDYVLSIGSKPAHLVFSIVGNDAGISGTSYEGIVSNDDGTLVPSRNNNRLSSNASSISNRVNPTGINITNALTLRTFRSGSGGNPAQIKSGSVERNREVILKPNTKYLIRTTNLSISTNNVSFEFSWYEL